MATTNCFKYYKTWDNINRRFLVKANLEDEWELSPTPDLCCTRGRKFNSSTGNYDPPFVKNSDLPRFWSPKEGRWIFEMTVKETKRKEDNPNTDNIEVDKIGVNIAAVRDKFF